MGKQKGMEFSLQVDLYHHCVVLESHTKSSTLETEWKLGCMDTSVGDIEVVLI